LLAQAAENLEAVHAREHDVEYDEVIIAVQGCLEPALAVVFTIDRIAFAMKELFEQRA
jgi:hypothetical protein